MACTWCGHLADRENGNHNAYVCKTVLYSGVSRAQHLFACSAELEGLGQDSAYNGHLLALITGLTPFSPGLESVVSPGDRDLDGSLTSSGQTKWNT